MGFFQNLPTEIIVGIIVFILFEFIIIPMIKKYRMREPSIERNTMGIKIINDCKNMGTEGKGCILWCISTQLPLYWIIDAPEKIAVVIFLIVVTVFNATFGYGAFLTFILAPCCDYFLPIGSELQKWGQAWVND